MRHFRNNNLSNVVHAKRVPIKLSFNLHNLIATWFFLGLSPIAPGTLGSLGAYPIFYLAINRAAEVPEIVNFLYIMAGLLFVVGWWAAARFHRDTMLFDHQSVVIDEVVGQLLTCALCFGWLNNVESHLLEVLNISQHTFVFLISFLAFRYFDITKPLILGYIDRNYKSAFAVMLDDVIAALFAGVTIYIFCLIHATIT